MDLSEVKAFEQKTRQLKLSEAIRIGAKYRPQTFETVSDSGGTCALGAAYEGLHGPYTANEWYRDKIYTELRGLYGIEICDMVIGWNDGRLWSREYIAERLEHLGR